MSMEVDTQVCGRCMTAGVRLDATHCPYCGKRVSTSMTWWQVVLIAAGVLIGACIALFIVALVVQLILV